MFQNISKYTFHKRSINLSNRSPFKASIVRYHIFHYIRSSPSPTQTTTDTEYQIKQMNLLLIENVLFYIKNTKE